jgi:membrane protease YdiL (CAAX protease family)
VSVDIQEVRRWLVERRWAVALTTGLLLIVLKRLLGTGSIIADHLLYYTAAPLLLVVLLQFPRVSVGLAAPEGRKGWLIVSAVLVLAVVFAFVGTLFPGMMEYYPVELWGPIEDTIPFMIQYEAAMAVLLFATELMYRGWLVMATSERLGRWSALVAAIPYALLHLGKPTEEVVFSFFAGIAFGLADLEARSLLPSFASHFLGSALFDVLALRA